MAEGRVTVNGRVAAEPGLKVDPARDEILVDGRLLGPPEKPVYFMFHKPAGCLTTLDDPQGRPPIKLFLDRLPARVFPVGRLDMDVEGLLLLTNDGPLARRLMHPSSRVPKVYRVKVEGLPTEADLEKLRSGGLRLGDRPAAAAGADLLKTAREESPQARAWLLLTLTEGRRRQVKRMCSAIGHPVLKLKRVSYAGLDLGGLRRAATRPLAPAEILLLRRWGHSRDGKL
jgi:23S rRNA pseudouridine2605 synthase